jgi:hypothetical protein
MVVWHPEIWRVKMRAAIALSTGGKQKVNLKYYPR